MHLSAADKTIEESAPRSLTDVHLCHMPLMNVLLLGPRDVLQSLAGDLLSVPRDPSLGLVVAAIGHSEARVVTQFVAAEARVVTQVVAVAIR